MKKLVLLVSVFLLLTGMVFADVTFAPAVTGDASVTWGLDLMPDGKDYEKVNSGFTAENNSSFDLGVTIDPFDAMTGEEGMYGEIELTGMAVTAKSGSDVAVTAPTVTAKLYFMESLYMRVCTNPAPEYDVVTPLGALITVDDNDQEGTWYDTDGTNDTGTTVEADYGEYGYGFTYMMDALTVNADFVSNDDWGKDDVTASFKREDYNDDKDDILTGVEFKALVDAVTAKASELSAADTYSPKVNLVYADGYNYDDADLVANGGDGNGTTTNAEWEAYIASGNASFAYAASTLYEITTNDDDEIQLIELESDGDVNYVYDITGGGADIETSLYTLGLDVTYDLDGIGTFMAYVLPMHASQWNTFSAWGYGGKVTIDAVDMVTPVFAVDAKYDETNGFIGGEKLDILEWEAYVELPVSYEVSEDVSVDATVKFAATDSEKWAPGNEKYNEERVVYDVYASAGADVMGASLDAAYMVSDAFYEAGMSSSMTLDASYELEAMGGTITPSAGWAVDFTDKTKGDEEGYLTVAVAAAVVDNTTFTLKYASGDLLENPYDTDSHDPGVVTFETKIAY